MTPIDPTLDDAVLLAACATALAGCSDHQPEPRLHPRRAGRVHRDHPRAAGHAAELHPAAADAQARRGRRSNPTPRGGAGAGAADGPGRAAGGNSPGQQALVQAAGPPATPDIRTEVDQQAVKDRPSNGFFDKLMFWRKPREPGIVVDPPKRRSACARTPHSARARTPAIRRSSSPSSGRCWKGSSSDRTVRGRTAFRSGRHRAGVRAAPAAATCAASAAIRTDPRLSAGQLPGDPHPVLSLRRGHAHARPAGGRDPAAHAPSPSVRMRHPRSSRMR